MNNAISHSALLRRHYLCVHESLVKLFVLGTNIFRKYRIFNCSISILVKMSADSKNLNSSKKKGGGFLQRQAKAKAAEKNIEGSISEEELLRKETISPDDVLKLSKITKSEYFQIFFSLAILTVSSCFVTFNFY